MRPIYLVALALALMAASGCSTAPVAARPDPTPPPTATAEAAPTPPPTAEAAPYPLTIADDADRQVAIPAEPHRIVSLSASNTEMLYALGLGDRVVGVDQYSDYPPSVEGKPQVGSFASPDLEKIVALEPDLVLGTEIHLKTTLPELERRGVRVAISNPKDAAGVLSDIALLGRIAGRQEEAAALCRELQSRIDSVQSRVQGSAPVRVFFELSPELHTAGPGSFVNDLIRLAGGTNVAANAGEEWPQLNQEALFLADPEVILLADHAAGETPEGVAARPGWRTLSAVKNGRVVVVDPNLVNRPGPRIAEGLELIARNLHPESAR